MTVYDLKKGERAIILSMQLPTSLFERLNALGVYPRAVISLEKISLFKNTYVVQANGTRIVIHRSIAQRIRVVKT